MADRYYTCVLGANGALEVTEGAAATGANAFDFRVTYDATGVAKHETLKALRAIEFYITRDTWPPV